MQLPRRKVLAVAGIGAATGGSGCIGALESVSEVTPRDGNRPGAGPFSLGESVVFTTPENGRVSFTPTGASLRAAVFHVSNGHVGAETPKEPGAMFLAVDVTVENTSDKSVELPKTILFELDGKQSDGDGIKFLPQEDQYEYFGEIRPGTSDSSILLFPIQPKPKTGELIVESDGIDEKDTSATWTIDLADVERTATGYGDLDPGESVTVGTDAHQFSVSAKSATERQSYTDEDGNTVESESESKFVHITLSARNTGPEAVSLPSWIDCSLVAGSAQYDAESYDGDSRYEAGNVAPDVVREGIVQFTVPESVSSYEFRVAIDDALTAKWAF